MARGFGMEALAYDLRQDPFMAEVIGFRYVPLPELLAESDIISLHAPLLPSTQHLINKENIRQVKRGALLINTSRGGLVDTDALFQGLEDGVLGGAGLDVLEGEEFAQAVVKIGTEEGKQERDGAEDPRQEGPAQDQSPPAMRGCFGPDRREQHYAIPPRQRQPNATINNESNTFAAKWFSIQQKGRSIAAAYTPPNPAASR
jgi:hypothetical protein